MSSLIPLILYRLQTLEMSVSWSLAGTGESCWVLHDLHTLTMLLASYWKLKDSSREHHMVLLHPQKGDGDQRNDDTCYAK